MLQHVEELSAVLRALQHQQLRNLCSGIVINAALTRPVGRLATQQMRFWRESARYLNDHVIKWRYVSERVRCFSAAGSRYVCV